MAKAIVPDGACFRSGWNGEGKNASVSMCTRSTYHQGDILHGHAKLGGRKNCGLDSFSPISPLKELRLSVIIHFFLLFLLNCLHFFFFLAGKLNQRGALQLVRSTASDVVTCSSAKKNGKVLCQRPHGSSLPVRPRHGLSKNVGKFQ